MPSTARSSIYKALPLLFILFIDGMGLGLFIPLLNGLVISPHSHLLPVDTPNAVRDMYYGIIVGIFMICWFFGAALLGDMSDMIGRKKSLIICLVGTFLGYFISAISVICSSLGGIIAGRVIAGFTAGSEPIAQAAIVDISSEKELAVNMGYMMLAHSLGFVFGPIIAGILSDPTIVVWFNFETPLYFASLISLLNALALWFTFKESFTPTKKFTLKLHHAIVIFVSAFTHRSIRYLSLAYLFMMLGWSAYFNFIMVYMQHLYHMTTMQNSLFMGLLGIGSCIGLGVLVKPLTKRFGLKPLSVWGFGICGVMPLLTVFSHSNPIAWISFFLAGVSIGWGYSTILTLFSNEVSPEEQGWVMGVTGAVMALSFGLTGFFTGYFARFGTQFPLIFGGVALLMGSLILVFASLKQTHSVANTD